MYRTHIHAHTCLSVRSTHNIYMAHDTVGTKDAKPYRYGDVCLDNDTLIVVFGSALFQNLAYAHVVVFVHVYLAGTSFSTVIFRAKEI